jgi:hypothetical protein
MAKPPPDDRFALMVLPAQSAKAMELAKAQKVRKGLYAAMPGTGPEGEKCGTCKHMVQKQMSRGYRKCALTRQFWTGGPGTDIKAGTPACSKWEKGEDAATRSARTRRERQEARANIERYNAEALERIQRGPRR